MNVVAYFDVFVADNLDYLITSVTFRNWFCPFS